MEAQASTVVDPLYKVTESNDPVKSVAYPLDMGHSPQSLAHLHHSLSELSYSWRELGNSSANP